MDFSDALVMIKKGVRMGRETWPSFMYVVYQKGYPDGIAINANTAEATGLEEGTTCRFQPYLMLGVEGDTFGPYTPTQADLTATDWYPA